MKILVGGLIAIFAAWAIYAQNDNGPMNGPLPQILGHKPGTSSAPKPAGDGAVKDPGKASADAPPEPDDSPIKVAVSLVNVMASVRDKHGAFVPTLTKDDFEIYENGQPQTIKYFSKETNLPLTIGLLVDVSKSQERLIDIEQQAAGAFLDSVIKPKDQAFIISFGADSDMLCDLTGSKKLLREGLHDLKPNFGFSGITPGPVPTMSHQAGTVLYDAIYLASNERLSKEVGRKAIVVITDGDDEGSKENIKSATEAAQRANTAIYSIYYVDTGFYMRYGMIGGGGGRGYLERMSGDTGGHVFEVNRKNTLEKVFDELQEALRTQYSIGYTSTNPKKDGAYRKLEVRAKDHDLKVEARRGYYATANEE